MSARSKRLPATFIASNPAILAHSGFRIFQLLRISMH
jgi:hypothetical protein